MAAAGTKWLFWLEGRTFSAILRVVRSPIYGNMSKLYLYIYRVFDSRSNSQQCIEWVNINVFILWQKIIRILSKDHVPLYLANLSP